MSHKFLVACICSFSVLANAQESSLPLVTMGTRPVFTAQDRAQFVNKPTGQEQAAQATATHLATDNPYLSEAMAIRDLLQGKTRHTMQGMADGALGTADMSKAHYDTLVFASFSLSEETLKLIYRAAAGSERTAIVFRGLPPNCTTINQAIRKMQSLAIKLKLKTPPNVLINPVWFKQYQVNAVPTILVLEQKTPNRSGNPATGKVQDVPKVIASVRGLADPAWLYQRLSEGRKGDLGQQGPTNIIAEKDLIDEMIARAENIDWEQKKQQALSRVWTNLPISELSPALSQRKRLIDPTFTVNQDVKLPNGQFIAHQGDKINPLDRRQFNRLLVIFNGSVQREMAYVKEHLASWIAKANVQPHQVKLIITGLDRKRGWDSYASLMNFFDDEIFVLTPEVKQSFALEHTPSIVYADGRRFAVEEFNVNE